MQDAGAKAAAMAAGTTAGGTFLQLRDGRFVDDRWSNGRWDLSLFKNAAGETDWDAVSEDTYVVCVIDSFLSVVT